MFYASLTSVLGIADLLYSSWSKSDWSFANIAFRYLFIFFSNDWISVSLRHSVSEFLYSSCTFSCLLNYRSVPLLFSFQLQVQVLFLALRWTEGIMEENRLYNLRFWYDIELVVQTCRSYQKIIGKLGWEPRKLRLRASKKKFMKVGRQEEEIKIKLCILFCAITLHSKTWEWRMGLWRPHNKENQNICFLCSVVCFRQIECAQKMPITRMVPGGLMSSDSLTHAYTVAQGQVTHMFDLILENWYPIKLQNCPYIS